MGLDRAARPSQPGLRAAVNLPGAGSNAIAEVLAISGDGTTVVGDVQGDANGLGVFWNTTNGSVQFLTPAYSAEEGRAVAVSNDGSVILTVGGTGVPYEWTEDRNDLEPIPLLSQSPNVDAVIGTNIYVSGDGSTITGFEGESGVFRTTIAGPPSLIIPGKTFPQSGVNYSIDGVNYLAINSVVGVSSDGSVVAGQLLQSLSPGDGYTSFRWDNGDLSILPDGQNYSYSYLPSFISPDGSVIVGQERTITSGGELWQSYFWGPTGVQTFGPNIDVTNDPEDTFEPTAASNNAQTIVGWERGFNSSSTTEAIIWDATNGVRDLQNILVSDGLGPALAGWDLTGSQRDHVQWEHNCRRRD